jgi:hypothetical protein
MVGQQSGWLVIDALWVTREVRVGSGIGARHASAAVDAGGGSMKTAARTSFREDKFPPVFKALIVVGLIVNVAFLLGIPFPRRGALDTIAVAAILIGNAYIFLFRYCGRW